MQRRLSTTRPWLEILLLATSTAVLSCGSGIHIGEGDQFARKTIDQNGDKIVLREAVLDVVKGALSASTQITVRRFEGNARDGAISPIFEIEIPTPDSFANNPRLFIAASTETANDPTSYIGHMDGAWWIPEQPRREDCEMPSSVCGHLQTSLFSERGLTRLDYAIVKRCESRADCLLPDQSCQSNACQYCPTCGP